MHKAERSRLALTVSNKFDCAMSTVVQLQQLSLLMQTKLSVPRIFQQRYSSIMLLISLLPLDEGCLKSDYC